MKIKISDKNKRQEDAVLITFDTIAKRFANHYERNTFFRGLHGWKQIINKNNKKYMYRRNGLLDELPHMKVADSAFIVSNRYMKNVINYMKQWEPKVEFRCIKIRIKRGVLNGED